ADAAGLFRDAVAVVVDQRGALAVVRQPAQGRDRGAHCGGDVAAVVQDRKLPPLQFFEVARRLLQAATDARSDVDEVRGTVLRPGVTPAGCFLLSLHLRGGAALLALFPAAATLLGQRLLGVADDGVLAAQAEQFGLNEGALVGLLRRVGRQAAVGRPEAV